MAENLNGIDARGWGEAWGLEAVRDEILSGSAKRLTPPKS